MKPIIYLFLAICLNYQGFSQVMTTDDLVKKAKLEGYLCLYEFVLLIPQFIYFLDTNTAIDLSCIEIEDCLNDKIDRDYPQDAYDFSRKIDKNQKLGNAFFNFYNQKMIKFKSESSPSFSIFKERWFSDDLFCALIKHNPEGLKDTLINDLNFLQAEAKKIHPDSYSFFGDIWQFFANGLYSYRDYRNCMEGYLLIASALKEIGEGAYAYGMLANLDTEYFQSAQNERIVCEESDFFEEIPDDTLMITLKNKYSSISELVKSDAVIRNDLLSYIGDIFVCYPKLIFEESALFWVSNRFGNFKSLIKVIYINENTVNIIDLCTTF